MNLSGTYLTQHTFPVTHKAIRHTEGEQYKQRDRIAECGTELQGCNESKIHVSKQKKLHLIPSTEFYVFITLCSSSFFPAGINTDITLILAETSSGGYPGP